MNPRSFATAINCMDGRTYIRVINHLRKKFDLNYVDIIAEPGPVRILAEGKVEDLVQSIRRRLEIFKIRQSSRGNWNCWIL